MNFGGSYVLNQPTGDQSAIRLAVLYQDDDGFIDDIGLGRDDINSTRRSALRLSGLWNPTDNLEVLARIYAENIESGGYNYTDPFGKPWNALPTTDEYQRVLYSPEPRDEGLRLASLRLKWQMAWGEVYSATSWYEKDALMNVDWSPELYIFFGIDSEAPFSTDIHQRDISQEFRISSDREEINWLAGFYYLNQESDRLDFGTVPGFFDVILNVQEKSVREDTALFGEVSWQLRDDLAATIGGRWYKNDRDFSSVGYFATNSLDSTLNGGTSDYVFKASLSWDISEETMVYGLYSEGFRPGQLNNSASVALCGSRVLIDSDDLSNYEAGVKTRSDDGRFSLNATAFHIDWNSMQISALDEVCGFVVLDNVGKATSDGLEVDFSWLVNDAFSLEGGFGYNKAELAQAFTDPSVDTPAGTRIPNVPRWTANLAATWNFQWRNNTPVFLNASVQHIGSRNTIFDQSPAFPRAEHLDAYTLLNFRLGADIGAWYVELFINNLTGELAVSSCCRIFNEPTVVRPRTIGIRTTVGFD